MLVSVRCPLACAGCKMFCATMSCPLWGPCIDAILRAESPKFMSPVVSTIGFEDDLFTMLHHLLQGRSTGLFRRKRRSSSSARTKQRSRRWLPSRPWSAPSLNQHRLARYVPPTPPRYLWKLIRLTAQRCSERYAYDHQSLSDVAHDD